MSRNSPGQLTPGDSWRIYLTEWVTWQITAARLASLAKTGEILISDEAAQNAEIDTKNLEKRQLDLKGKSEPVTAWVINVGA